MPPPAAADCAVAQLTGAAAAVVGLAAALLELLLELLLDLLLEQAPTSRAVAASAVPPNRTTRDAMPALHP